MSESRAEINLSVAAASIVSNAVLVSYHLFCPFCADFYLFEFSFKDHLKREHSDLLQKHFKHFANGINEENQYLNGNRFRKEFDSVCELCGAMFMYSGLIPKHIVNYHGSSCFGAWQRQQQIQSENPKTENFNERKDTTIMLAQCSPGLSEIFDNISTNDNNEEFLIDQTPLKSILKKSVSSARIITSPSSSCIRRIKNSSTVKKSTARRILRFDIENYSPKKVTNEQDGIAATNLYQPRVVHYTKTKSKKSVGRIVRRILFGQCASNVNANKSPTYRMVTSTPINFLDDASFY